MATDTYLEKELNSLFSKTFELGNLAERAMTDAVWSLSHQDRYIARTVIEGDDRIDALAMDINTASFQLIALYQPVALDLRSLEAIVRMALDLERISDLAANVAQITINCDPPIEPPAGLQPMGELVVEMLNIAMAALLKRDADSATKIFPMDDGVDDYEDSVFGELMKIVMDQRKTEISTNRLITVSRILERAGDHVTNIAEQICYMMWGKRVKASEYRRPKAVE